MAMVGVVIIIIIIIIIITDLYSAFRSEDTEALDSFWQPVQADSQPKSSGLVLGQRPFGAILHSSNEPAELSQWFCHDDSTINIVVLIIIIIITGGNGQ